MKTMNLKKAASVMVLASVATVMSAQTPESSECNGIGKCSNGDERTDSGEVVQ